MKKYIFLVLSLFLQASIASIAQNAPRREAIKQIKDGDSYLRMGNWNDAMLCYGNAINADASFADAFMKRAVLHRKLGMNREADLDYQRPVSLNPGSVYIYDQRFKLNMLAMEYYGSNPSAQAMDNVQPIALDVLADDWIQRGAYQKAMELTDSLIAMGFEKDFEWEKKALLHLLQGEWVKSGEAADSALMISSTSALAHDLKGLSQLKAGQSALALESFTKAIQLEPNFAVAYFNRASAYIALGDVQMAMKDLEKGFRMNQEASMNRYVQAIAMQPKTNWSEAINTYNDALELDGSNTQILFNRAFTWKMLGDFSKAMEDAQRIVELAPDSPQYWNLKGNMHMMYAEYTEAAECYGRAIGLNAEYAEAYYNRGLAFLMNYDPDNGCMDLNQSAFLGYQRAIETKDLFCGK